MYTINQDKLEWVGTSYVLRITASNVDNPFSFESHNIINIVTGQCADTDMKTHLTFMKSLDTEGYNEWEL